MAEEAAQECETALSLDRGDNQFRSCAMVFEQLGQTDKALPFAALDSGSQWTTVRSGHSAARWQDKRSDGKGKRVEGARRQRFPYILSRMCRSQGLR